MQQYLSRLAIWVIALLVVTPLGGCRLAAQDGDTFFVGADQPAPLIEDQNVPPSTPSQEQPEVLSRGPVHEAFAEPVDMQLQAGLIAPDQPPPNIEEFPPDERPQGQPFVWIPGYWSWDADRKGYIWVSGCWRVAPPRMSWVPGYWSQVSGGWEWVAGFWASAGVREIEYLPAPPADYDVEPHGSPPSLDTIWVPPCMYWVQGQYVRRSGYWLAAHPNWVWVPSHYVWTPRGYVFADGHWDYSLERRGVLFAPVYFPASVYGRADFTYSPSIIIDVGLLRVSLFAYPSYSHYYFGDYYDDAYLRIGIYPWFDSQRLHTWYDPIYEYDRWQHQRSEPRWADRERDEYNRRRADRDLRPARTYREQESRLARLPELQRQAFQVTQPLTVAVTSRQTPLRFERINTDVRQKISRQATAVSTFRDERTRWESTVTQPTEHRQTVQPPVERRATVTPPTERRQTVQPSTERRTTVTPPAERRQTVQPSTERRTTVTEPTERRQTVQPTMERRTTVTEPTERRQTVQPTMERRTTVTPSTERRQTVQPSTERRPVTAPVAQRQPVVVPPRQVNVSQPERVRIPVPPVVGGSGVPGIFQKGPPARPADEARVNEGQDLRKKKAADRNSRNNGNDQHGD